MNKTPFFEERETIHSGQFMVSHFEAEEQDDEDELAVPVPDDSHTGAAVVPVAQFNADLRNTLKKTNSQQQLEIDTSLSKLFHCMSLAYRQKLTSPKWNRFRGIRLRWKEKIRLNNVIWRCWHLQFIKKANTLLCQFASPLEVDTHNKPEAVVLEGKYWKRKLAACTAEYKKWRMFYRNHCSGHSSKDIPEMLTDVELLMLDPMTIDEEYIGFMSDTLFSTITNQPFAFPDSREIAKMGYADFIQPSLGPLQPNLDDYMDTMEPLQDLISYRLPIVLEEQCQEPGYKSLSWNYPEADTVTSNSSQVHLIQNSRRSIEAYNASDVGNVALKSNLPTQGETKYQRDVSKTSRQSCIDHFQLDQQSIIPHTSVIIKEKDVKSQSVEQKKETSCDAVAVPYRSTDRGANHNEKFQDDTSHKMESSLLQREENFKFTLPVLPKCKLQSPNEEKKEHRTNNTRRKQRSHSNTRESIKQPPILSAVSDPSLASSCSALLTKLLSAKPDKTTSVTDEEATDLISTCHIKKEECGSTLVLAQLPPISNTTPDNMNAAQDSSSDMVLNSLSGSTSPILEINAQSISSPTSSHSSLGSPNRDSPKDYRSKTCHLQSEQKRRISIRNGFDTLYSLIPQMSQNSASKLSKAAMLQKGAEYIRQLKIERDQLKGEMDRLRQQIDTLSSSISNCQSMLPATGAPVSKGRDNKMEEMYDEYVKSRTIEDWKFWIFSLLFRPLLTSFNNIVSTSSLDDLYRSTLLWIEQHCTLGELRPVVLTSLRYLSTRTEVLSEPEKLPEEVRKEVLLSSSFEKEQ